MLNYLIKILFAAALIAGSKFAYEHYVYDEIESNLEASFESYDPDDYEDDNYAYDDYDTGSDW